MAQEANQARPCVFIHTNERQMLGALVGQYALKRNSPNADRFDVRILKTEDYPFIRAKEGLAASQKAIDEFAGDESERGRLELARDEARNAFQKEDRTYQLLKDISENLSIGYDVGETLVTKLKQTHDVKDQVYRRAVTFFTTN